MAGGARARGPTIRHNISAVDLSPLVVAQLAGHVLVGPTQGKCARRLVVE